MPAIQKMRRPQFLIPLVLILLLAGIIYVRYKPRPIVSDAEHCMIARVQINTDGLPADYTDYDEDKVIAVLSDSYERRTFQRARPYLLGDVEVYVMLMTEDGLREVLLGEMHYTSGGYGTTKYDIIDPQEVKARLLEALLPDDEESP